MKVQPDPLFDIFRKHLNQALIEDEVREEEIINKTVQEYMDRLSARGYVPPRLQKFLEQDVRDDVTQMLKKTTYGYFNLNEYHKARGQLVNKIKVRGC